MEWFSWLLEPLLEPRKLTRLLPFVLLPPALSFGPAILRVVGACFAKRAPFSARFAVLFTLESSCDPPALFLDFLVLASEGELLSFFERLRSSKVSRPVRST